MFNSMQNQLGQFQKQAASAGFSGTGIMDVHPELGVIRLKLSTVPSESLREFTANFSQMLTMLLGGLNITVKKHVAEEESK